jgi:predicted DNA-binding transcriptional regulator AlpA
MNIGSSAVLRAAAAAEYLGLSVSTLTKMRMRGDGPTFVKLGRSVGYIPDDLNIWRNDRRRRSTHDNAPVPPRADPAHSLEELVDFIDRALGERIAMGLRD